MQSVFWIRMFKKMAKGIKKIEVHSEPLRLLLSKCGVVVVADNSINRTVCVGHCVEIVQAVVEEFPHNASLFFFGKLGRGV